MEVTECVCKAQEKETSEDVPKYHRNLNHNYPNHDNACMLSCCPVQLLAMLWKILPGSSAHEILQARILEWVAMLFSGDLLNPAKEPLSLMSPPLAGRFSTTSATWEAQSRYYCIITDPDSSCPAEPPAK